MIGPDGCPWDREQTPQTLADYLVEETFELVSAIRAQDAQEVQEEMGDVFFLLFFICVLYRENFHVGDILDNSAAKMIRRHPHVFGETSVQTQEEISANWEKIKKREKNNASKQDRIFASLPRDLPPLIKAYRLNSKAARSDFTWPNTEEVGHKLSEEWEEWEKALYSGDREKMEEELGDFLFTLTEYARRHNIKLNTALDKSNHKFLSRFELMEDLAQQNKTPFSEVGREEKEALWAEAKGRENWS